MKKFYLGILALLFANGFAQPISVNNTTFTVPQLVNSVFVNNPNLSVTNVTWRTGTNYGLSNGIGYFQNTNTNLPFQSGIVLSTGNALNTAGPNTTTLSEGSSSWFGDINLNATLSSAGNAFNSFNATVLEFDFTPSSSSFEFDYLFASEEYGLYQCNFSDGIVFLLTDLNTGITTNLAVIPGTNTPVSVNTIRNSTYNTSCFSVNANYFGVYNTATNLSAATNFNGQTVKMKASSTVNPNNPYHLKMVVADRADSQFDSAIFLGSQSLSFSDGILGPDLTVANNTALCTSNILLNTNLNASNYTFEWRKNAITIAGANNSILTINSSGTYDVIYTNITTQITYTDTIIVESGLIQPLANIVACNFILPIIQNGDYFLAPNGVNPISAGSIINSSSTIYVRNTCNEVSFTVTIMPIPINTPINLEVSEVNSDGFATFNLDSTIPVILGSLSPNDYQVSFYNTLSDATFNTGAIANTSNYINSSNPQTIYVRVTSLDSNCFVTTSFTLHVTTIPLTTFGSFVVYENSTDGIAIFDLTSQISSIIGVNSDPNNFIVSFFISYTDALANINSIVNPNAFINTSNPQTIYVRVTNLNGRLESTIYGTIQLSVQETLSNATFDLDTIKIAPNPIVDFITISAKQNFNSITILNALGQIILDQKVNSSNAKIDLSSLKSGNYFLKVNFEKANKVLQLIKK